MAGIKGVAGKEAASGQHPSWRHCCQLAAESNPGASASISNSENETAMILFSSLKLGVYPGCPLIF